MKKFLTLSAILALSAGVAYADGYDLANLNVSELPVLAAASVDSAADYMIVLDSSANFQPKKVLASAGILGDGITATAAEINYVDLTTLGTGAASKAVVLDASGDYTYPASATIVMPSGGTETYQSGSTLNIAGTFQVGGSSVTSAAAELNYVDLTTLGTVQASKALTADASNDVTYPATFAGIHQSSSTDTYQSGSSLVVASGATLSVAGATVNPQALALPGRVDITICGDGTTINNNTVYYGPSMVPVANGIRTCDTTQVGNTTEATADEAALDATAFQVLSMDCLTADPGAAGVSFTLRSAAAATTPSVTCSVANTKKGCTANVQTTTAIASGATIDIAAASTGNQGTTPFACTIHAAY